MFDAAHVYGFDIETLNDEGQGLDPTHPRARITEISVATSTGAQVLGGDDERQLLRDFADLLRSLPAGLLVGWNSSGFDLPFLHTRARTSWCPRLLVGLHLTPQRGLTPKYGFLPGHDCAYSATLRAGDGTHSHLDIAYAWKSFAESFGDTEPDQQGRVRPKVTWSLKPVAEAAGIRMVRLDATRLHEFTAQQRAEYVASDASGARLLALRTLGLEVGDTAA